MRPTARGVPCCLNIFCVSTKSPQFEHRCLNIFCVGTERPHFHHSFCHLKIFCVSTKRSHFCGRVSSGPNAFLWPCITRTKCLSVAVYHQDQMPFCGRVSPGPNAFLWPCITRTKCLFAAVYHQDQMPLCGRVSPGPNAFLWPCITRTKCLSVAVYHQDQMPFCGRVSSVLVLTTHGRCRMAVVLWWGKIFFWQLRKIEMQMVCGPAKYFETTEIEMRTFFLCWRKIFWDN